MLRKTYGEIIADPKKAKADFMRLGGERIKFFDRAQLHKTEVENILTKITPGLIIIDNMVLVPNVSFKTISEAVELIKKNL